MIMVFVLIKKAINEFTLDPRSTPPFEDVFHFQYLLINTISIELFLRILNVVITLSCLNMIKSKFKVILALIAYCTNQFIVQQCFIC